MSLDERINEPIIITKRIRNSLVSKIGRLSLSAILAFSTAFLLKGCDKNDPVVDPPIPPYEGNWIANWDYAEGSCDVSGGPLSIPITSTNGGNFYIMTTEYCSTHATLGNCRLSGSINPTSGAISGTHFDGPSCTYSSSLFFVGQCSSTTGTASGPYSLSMTFDKQ